MAYRTDGRLIPGEVCAKIARGVKVTYDANHEYKELTLRCLGDKHLFLKFFLRNFKVIPDCRHTLNASFSFILNHKSGS